MAMEQNYIERETQVATDGNILQKPKWETVSTPTEVPEKDRGCFECNICLESAYDPVVTLCGHLYCWPCIYEWLNVKTSSPNADNQSKPRNCPVCKANISASSLVPLYGHGSSSSSSSSESKSRNCTAAAVPCRPTPSFNTSSRRQSTRQLHQNFLQSQSRSPALNDQLYCPHHYSAIACHSLGGMATASLVMEMIRGMPLSWILGSSAMSSFTYPPFSQPMTLSSNPRARRQEIEYDMFLNRISIFFLVCTILCLLLF